MVKIFCFNYKMQTFSYSVEPPGPLVQDRKTKTGSGTAKWRKKRGGGRESEGDEKEEGIGPGPVFG